MTCSNYTLQSAITIKDLIAFHRICKTELHKGRAIDYVGEVRTSDATSPDTQKLLLRFNGNAIGTAQIDAHKPVPTIADLTNVAITKQFQGQGHGDVLLDLTSSFARSAGFKSLAINAEPHPKVVAFFERCGFRQEVWDQDFLDEWDEELSGPPYVQMVKDL